LRYAIIFLIISLVAGAFGLTNISVIAKRISLILFGIFFIIFLIVLGIALLLGEALRSSMLPVAIGWVAT
jgi:uncharacterized membrane protein YtjA (UPF0391 family)